MTELGDLAPPIVSAATRLQGHRAGRQRGQERKQLAPAQLLATDHRARAAGSMELKDVLGEIEADGAHRVHGRLLEWPATPLLWHTTAVGGRPHGVIAGASRPIVPTVSEPAWSRLLLFRS